MSPYMLAALMLSCAAVGFMYGMMYAGSNARRADRAWTDGYAAGLAKADEMWPTVVRRWEMR